jgi:hypothetical protein
MNGFVSQSKGGFIPGALLVAIAIISLLTTLLFPVLCRAREMTPARLAKTIRLHPPVIEND